jgi:hypothetical protein
MKRILYSTVIVFIFLVSTAFSFYERVHVDGRSVGNDHNSKMIAVEYELTMADLTSSESRAKSLPVGHWGGEHIRVEVTGHGAAIEYDCAHATINRRITIDRNRRFNVSGMQFQEQGGPVRQGSQSAGYSVRFKGQINGETMTLSVSNNLTKELVGTFTLVHGAEARLMKCK